ncbi:hypothetical protein PVAG01_10736 [Phlyctema vagabunda]|uniref:Malectin-like domain-containing protein n=1 Tax=Phlyctema vagabunda TaxID=108571 RepID=A0ABR4P3S3_9HELO
MSQLWLFESPVAVDATAPVTVTWNPRTFNSVNYGNFNLNLWILREDLKTDAVINSYMPSLLLYNHSVFDNSVIWDPSLLEVDVNVTIANRFDFELNYLVDLVASNGIGNLSSIIFKLATFTSR